jgi:hypothetical protein
MDRLYWKEENKLHTVTCELKISWMTGLMRRTLNAGFFSAMCFSASWNTHETTPRIMLQLTMPSCLNGKML